MGNIIEKITITTDNDNNFFAIPSHLLPEFHGILAHMEDQFIMQGFVDQEIREEFDMEFMPFCFELEKEFTVLKNESEEK